MQRKMIEEKEQQDQDEAIMEQKELEIREGQK